MSFLNNLKKVLHIGGNESKKKKVFNNIRMECDPEEFWDMVGELGDGAFGKVYKVSPFSSSQILFTLETGIDIWRLVLFFLPRDTFTPDQHIIYHYSFTYLSFLLSVKLLYFFFWWGVG
jgi:hypothetical protein